MIDMLKKEIVDTTNATISVDEPMKKHTTYGIGGPAELFVLPSDKNDLISIVQLSKKYKQTVTIIGSGSNLLISDNGIKGVVISIKHCLRTINVDIDKIYVECGTMLGKIVKESMKHDLKGLENLIGVPGTLGGALMMNAGAWGGEVSENLESVELLNDKNEIEILSKSDIDFSYRSSSFGNDIILLSAIFKLKKSDKKIIQDNFDLAKSGRKNTQPLNYRSAGSVFKNPSSKHSAGMLIDQSGLKGFSVGDAKISNKHANFFLNTGDAKADDMISLIKQAKDAVKDQFNIQLDLEVRLLGFNSEEISEL
ncbi:MAG: UDP-N-acetylmuramate dehydrogenase [Candidatus Marinimicrobia bacterium]|jgi:UDP-N-acetylmuramate dehydrogenase|nr:UDP-N-acetylmuramate dehydrogenase [Candidatus Neomarinimicrobiota bacterium]MBT3728390.1 UDP-N-acetylmuramate dehydrogenase [Candidatus Neomarinimicrobiota bacterium]MBT3944030.1 UDP-N-acetylmuramate dehydrogenase [Candidatus Neomarinimicrobiota bacterium]MBT4111754.1 UDP-N-acetylmuramate dehydrogenase [Candidatus Neomarinimicrobiota bacterium]MBT4317251.1 UDP-N-acetylmuramate dehydrogenase [Candidatus Neomarinimicrobiota bacterium]